MRVAFIAASFSFSFLSAGAQAQPRDPNVEAARQHAERGQAALAANNFQVALDEYQQAYRLYPNPLLLINVAAAQSGLGRIEDATRTLEGVRGSDAVDDARKREVEAEIARLGRLLAELDIRTDPPGATVTVNGIDRGTSPVTVKVQPGPVAVRLTREGHQPARWNNDGAELRQSEHRTVEIDLVPVSSALPDDHLDDRIDEQPDLHLQEPRDPGGISPTWVWVSAVAAGGLAIGGSVFGVMTKSASDDWAAESCREGDDTDPCGPIETRHGRNALLSTALFIGAGVAAAAAIILYTQMSDGTPEEATEALNDLGVVRF
ncbi:MAG: PEGA domain-containing protein [Deltaproteobacteria bacterium]|nr:PEGA domain-containing protein [Deltaproteobacteria bacterium]